MLLYYQLTYIRFAVAIKQISKLKIWFIRFTPGGLYTMYKLLQLYITSVVLKIYDYVDMPCYLKTLYVIRASEIYVALKQKSNPD
jgi:hypothetical protein